MKDEELQRLLSSLPRERASREFTDQVMTRLGTSRRPFYLQPRFAVAASLIVVLSAWLGLGRWHDEQKREQARQKIQALRAEYEELEKNIKLLRELAPVLYVDGDDDVDFVIDLRRVTEKGNENLQPASFDDSNRQ